ncbi:WD repeat-containing protein 44 isoform X2 [Cajanus cajan]|uniref:WD repeat-containing protein 44 isoform X2 n=1 Tax=Cajanus cajan TaxID=3821 RepID=UPI00098DB26F|nr:WD repeat-containing protein 44 isoform X2 [Cajanus cajan]
MTQRVDDDTESCRFHDSYDRLLSSCSTSTSDDDTSTPQNDAVSLNALPQFPMCKYDAWISEPSSLSERRSRLLRQFGLPAPPPIPRSASSTQCTDTPAASISRSKSDTTADRAVKHCKSSVVPIDDNANGFLLNNNNNNDNNNNHVRSVNGASAPSVSVVSVFEDDDGIVDGDGNDNGNGNGNGNGDDNDEQACTIRDLDNGKEFVVKEDGVWNEVKEVGTGRRLTVEEFEMTVGHSPIVQELMRRQNVEEEGGDGEGLDGGDEGDGGGGGGGDGKVKKRGGGWFKFMSLKSVVVGQKERRSGDERDTSSSEKGGGRRSSSATDDSQDGGSGGLGHGGERVRVRQYGKSCKEVTGLYKSQEIQAHDGSIWSIKFSLDGRYLASAGEDCVIHVWQVVESERKGELLVEKPEDGNLNMLFVVNGSPEPLSPGLENNLEKKRRGRLSVSRKSLSLDQLVVPETVFALTEKPVCSFKGHLDDVLDLSWSKSQQLLSSSMDKTVRLWHLSSKSCLKIFSHSDYVTCIQFNPVDDRYFISGSLDAKVRIWSIPDRQVVDWIDLHEMVTAACYTPDGQGALVGSYKGSCHLYNTSENKLQQKSQINLQNRKKRSNHKKITGFQFVPGSSSEVLITSSDSRIRLVDGIDLVHKFKGFRNANSQISACLTENGKYVVSASEDSHVYIWKNEADCRPSRTKGVTVTSAYEHFHCKDVSVAIPWPGMDDAWEMHDTYFGEEPELDDDGDENNGDEVSSANHPPTPVEENFGSEGSQFASGCNNSPLHGTIASATDSYFLDRISAAWPEEKLLTTRERSPRVSVDLSNGVNQNMAWGMVIVTAGLQGEIKIFQNFGLALGI